MLLNVYDLLPPSGISEVLWLVGVGMHHSAVEVYGKEYSFGEHCNQPRVGTKHSRA